MRSSRLARLLSPLFVLALSTTLPGCGDEAKTTVIQAPPVLIAPVEVRRVRDRIQATGQLVARSQASVAAQVGGQITGIHVDEGAAVEAKQVILEIDPELRQLEVASQRARVAEAVAQLADEKRESRRLGSLRDRGVGSQADVEAAQTQMQLARSRLEAARIAA